MHRTPDLIKPSLDSRAHLESHVHFVIRQWPETGSRRGIAYLGIGLIWHVQLFLMTADTQEQEQRGTADLERQC